MLQSLAENARQHTRSMYLLLPSVPLKANYVVGGYVWSVKLTEEGKHYLAVNPNLHNPINWNLILAIVGVLISIIALFVSCMKKY